MTYRGEFHITQDTGWWISYMCLPGQDNKVPSDPGPRVGFHYEAIVCYIGCSLWCLQDWMEENKYILSSVVYYEMLIKSPSEGPSKILGEAAGKKILPFEKEHQETKAKWYQIKSILKITKTKTNKTENKMPSKSQKWTKSKCLWSFHSKQSNKTEQNV